MNLDLIVHDTAQEEIQNQVAPNDLVISNTLKLAAEEIKRYDPLETQPAERLDLLLRLEFEVVVISENSIQSLVKTILDTNLPPGYSAQSQSIDIQHLTKPLLGKTETWRWRVRARRDIVAHLTHTEVINLSLGLTPQEAGDHRGEVV